MITVVRIEDNPLADDLIAAVKKHFESGVTMVFVMVGDRIVFSLRPPD